MRIREVRAGAQCSSMENTCFSPRTVKFKGLFKSLQIWTGKREALAELQLLLIRTHMFSRTLTQARSVMCLFAFST